MNEQWRQAQLGKICEIILGQSPSSDTYNQERIGLPFFQGKSEFSSKYAQAKTWCCDPLKVAKKEDILISVRAPVGETNLAPENCCIGRGLAALRADQENLLQEFLWHQIGFKKGYLQGISQGSTFDAISGKDLSELEIAVPPLPEQKKIAEILSGIDRAIARTKFKVQKLDVLQFSLTEELTQDLQDNFEPSALEEYAEVRTGVTKNSNSEGDMIEMPYMRVANVQDGYLDLSEIKSISVDRGRIERYLLQKGDVLINEGGDLDKVGRGVIWNEEVKQCLHQNHVFAVRCSKRLIPEFLSLHLKSSNSKNYFLGCAKQTTNLASINSTQLKLFPIPVPPLEEQREFIERIRSVKDLSLAITAEMSALEAMKNAVSNDLLSGRKRVSV